MDSVETIEDFNCELCGKVSKNFRAHSKHVKNVHPKKTFQCPVTECQKTFKILQTLQNHKKMIHEKLKEFVCDKCGTKMSRFANLMDHRFKLHGDKKQSSAEYRSLITSGKHPYLEADSHIPTFF